MTVDARRFDVNSDAKFLTVFNYFETVTHRIRIKKSTIEQLIHLSQINFNLLRQLK